jgi:hypothetical protein
MTNLAHLAVVVLIIMLTGCASTLYSDKRLRSDTGGVLGVSPDAVTIQNRRSEGITTYYIAKTKDATYACTTVGGSIMNFGQSLPPRCSKK